MSSTRSCLLLSSLLVLTISAYGQNQTDIGSLKDNTLFEDAGGALSNGAGPNQFVGKNNLGQIRRGVIAFDVAGNIPPESTIDSVHLTLFMSQTSAPVETVELHRLTADWGEGTSNSTGGQGAPSTTGDATWIHTFFDTSFWTAVGGDFSATVSASLAIDSVDFYTWGSTAQMTADVQDWLDNPSSNFGWLLSGNEGANQTAKRFDTKENTVSGNRPVLTIFWTNPTSVGEQPGGLPLKFALNQNYPNPFNPSTIIRYELPQSRHVTLRVYNLIGQRVATLADDVQAPGEHEVVWNGRDGNGRQVPTGCYLYTIEAGEFVASHTMIVLK